METSNFFQSLFDVNTKNDNNYFICSIFKINRPFKYHDVSEPWETLEEKVEGNVAGTTSDTAPVVGIINDDNTAIDYGHSRSKQKDFKYDQFQSFLEALTSASSKFKAISMTTEQPVGEEFTTNSFNDLVM